MAWDVDVSRLGHYLGRYRERSLEGKVTFGSWEYPSEDIEQGCPAGWRMSPLVNSVLPHVRKRTENGDRVSSPYFDRIVNDETLLKAVLYYEHEEDRAIANWRNEISEDMRSKAKDAANKAAQR